MNKFTRRDVFCAAAGAAALTTMPLARTARAAVPLGGKQTAGWYRYKLGNYEITVATDGIARFKMAEDHVTNIKLDRVNAALAEVFMEKDMMTTPYNPICVNTGSKVVVIDTGTGEASYKKSNGVGGQFISNLAAAGIDRNAVDTVIISHYHGDHINGLLMSDNSLTYPNAEIVVPASEHKYWMDDGEMSRASKGRTEGNFKNVRRVFNAEVMKRVRTYEWGKEVMAGITARGTPGHTPGHTSFVIASGSDTVYVQSDVTHVPFLFVRYPDWHAFYDQDADMAQATRHKVYDMLAAEKMRVQGFHYPFPALAHVEKDGTAYRYSPLAWNPTI
ncbi:MAG TPA: MBL fold metallo-hydrolase [Pseudolabrys sp.]|jgi:glyoxylase-like metal-dependent hydrolase (beta-lactamase superfamily II)